MHTQAMCVLTRGGRNTYARALVEVNAEHDLVESLVVAIPYNNEEGHSLEKIEVEYDWRPPRCATCQIFDHNDNDCPKVIKEVTSEVTSKTMDDEGFIQVNRKNKGKHISKQKYAEGIKMTRPKVNLMSEKKAQGAASTSKTNKVDNTNTSRKVSHDQVGSSQANVGTTAVGSNDISLNNSFSTLLEDDVIQANVSDKIEITTDDDVEEIATENVEDNCMFTTKPIGASTPTNEGVNV